MRSLRNLLTGLAFSLLVVALPTVASAQWGGNNRDRDDDNYGRNGGYNRNGGYGNNGYYNGQLKSTIKRLKNDSKDFAKFVDRDLDNSLYNGSDREDRLNDLVKDFRNAANRLEDRFDERNINRTSGEVQNLLSIANQVDRAISRARLSYNVENYWNNIRYQLNDISNAYGYNYNNNNRNNRGRGNRNGNGDWRNRVPFPLPF